MPSSSDETDALSYTNHGPQVVIFPYPTKGHCIPFLHFAKQLSAFQNVTVTFINTLTSLSEDFLSGFEGIDNVKIVALGSDISVDGGGALPFLDSSILLAKGLERFLEGMPVAPTCIISDMFLGWVQDVANKLIIPRFVLFTTRAAVLAMQLHVPCMLAEGRLPVRLSSMELITDIPGTPLLRASDLPPRLMSSDHPNHRRFFEHYVGACRRHSEAAGVLINTVLELEENTIVALRDLAVFNSKEFQPSILSIGPLLPSTFFHGNHLPKKHSEDPPAPCIQWLDTQPAGSVVFVSFGSISSVSVPQLHALALGLESSKQGFLWVVRPPPPMGGSDSCTPKSISEYLPDGFEERTKTRGLVVSGWAPQLDVLSHLAVGGFLTHCGWNSTLESLCRGVPLLAWPLQAEQKMNCRFIVDELKAGVEVCQDSDGFVAKEEVERATRELMCYPGGCGARSRCLAIREMIIKAVGPGGSSGKNLQVFVDTITVQHNLSKNGHTSKTLLTEIFSPVYANSDGSNGNSRKREPCVATSNVLKIEPQSGLA